MTSILKVDTIQNSTGTDALSIDGSGNVSSANGLYPKGLDHLPSFLAIGTGGNTIQPGGGDQDVLSPLLTDAGQISGKHGLHNTGGHYDISTGKFTCPVAGHYFVSAVARWEMSSFTQGSYMRLFVGEYSEPNAFGSGISQINGNNEAHAAYMDMSVSGVLYCNAGDELVMQGGLNGGYAYLYTSECSFGATLLG